MICSSNIDIEFKQIIVWLLEPRASRLFLPVFSQVYDPEVYPKTYQIDSKYPLTYIFIIFSVLLPCFNKQSISKTFTYQNSVRISFNLNKNYVPKALQNVPLNDVGTLRGLYKIILCISCNRCVQNFSFFIYFRTKSLCYSLKARSCVSQLHNSAT